MKQIMKYANLLFYVSYLAILIFCFIATDDNIIRAILGIGVLINHWGYFKISKDD